MSLYDDASMNNNTEVIFENIEERILKEIQDAHYAIFVSVAWFTNKRLFHSKSPLKLVLLISIAYLVKVCYRSRKNAISGGNSFE